MIYIVKDTTAHVKNVHSLLKQTEDMPAVLLSNGAVVYQGQFLEIGKGTLPNGDYNYIATPSNTMEAKLKRGTTLKSIEVMEIKKKGNVKYGYWYLIMGEDNYIIQLEDAIATGEIILPKASVSVKK
jgi:hypothetical protein